MLSVEAYQLVNTIRLSRMSVQVYYSIPMLRYAIPCHTMLHTIRLRRILRSWVSVPKRVEEGNQNKTPR